LGCGYGCSKVLVAVDVSLLGLGEGVDEMVGVGVEVARRHPPTKITSGNINPVMMIEVYLLCMTQPN